MKPICILAASGVLVAACSAVIAGHDALTRQFYSAATAAGLTGPARFASLEA